MHLKPRIGLLIVFLIIILPVFSHLDDVPMQLWDESRLANSALEMYETGDLLVVTYDHVPDMWNTKPPLLIWMQALSLKIFGLSDLAVRLPSSIAAILTCLSLFWFFAKKLQLSWLGVLCVTVLITSPGYVMTHGARTADYDCMLTLFTTLYTLCFFLFLEEDKRKYFWATVVFAICATLTKGIEAVIFLPMLPVYALYKKKAGKMMRTPAIYLGIGIFLLFTLGYYFLREQYNPGYIKAVMANEVGGRYATVIEAHEGNKLYYINYLINNGFKPWYAFLALGAICGLLSVDQRIKNITLYALIMCSFFGMVISFGSTKLVWYALPLYPLMAIPTALFLYTIAQFLDNSTFWKPYITQNVLPYFFMVIVCFVPLKNICDQAMTAHGAKTPANDMATVLKKLLKDGYPYKTKMNVILDEYQGGIEWYLKVFNLRHIPIAQANKDSIGSEELVITYDPHVKKFIEQTYNVDTITMLRKAIIYQVHGKK
jgi:4-amino-4-deoxy-L-arabinose transferase-like glycosyltransferase